MASTPPQVKQPLVQQPTDVPEVIRLPARFTEAPMDMVCNVCRARIRTHTTESCNPICCILFGIFAMCMCQDVEHKCPNCNAVLGKYSAS